MNNFYMIRIELFLFSTLPNIETPYPMLILSGPDGCGRIELAHRLVEEFSEFFGYG